MFETDFEFGLDVVHAGEREILGQSAVAGDVEPSADALDDEVVHVEDFGKLRGHHFQLMLEFGVADYFFGLFDGRGFAFDVSENVGDFRDVAAHVGFELGDLIVGLFERHAFVELDVLLNVPGISMGQIKAGAMKAYAVTAPTRMPYAANSRDHVTVFAASAAFAET